MSVFLLAVLVALLVVEDGGLGTNSSKRGTSSTTDGKDSGVRIGTAVATSSSQSAISEVRGEGNSIPSADRPQTTAKVSTDDVEPEQEKEKEPESDDNASLRAAGDSDRARELEGDERPTRRRVLPLDAFGGATTLAAGQHNPLVAPAGVGSLVYVVDRSGSMANGPFQQVCDVLLDAIRQMDGEQRVAVIMFNDKADPPGGGRLQSVSPANTRALANQLRGIGTSGGTNPTRALLSAIEMAPDAIVVLSDGEFDENAINTVTRANNQQAEPITIHCIGLDANIRTLRELAARNGPGNYRAARIAGASRP